MYLKVYLCKHLFTFPIGERNISVNILKIIEFPVPNSPYLVEDTGDYAHDYLRGWIDVWFGFCTTCSKSDSVYDNKDRAYKFGNSTKVTYNYVTP